MKSLKISLLVLVVGVVGELKPATGVERSHSYEYEDSLTLQIEFNRLFKDYLKKNKGFSFEIATNVKEFIAEISKELDGVNSLTYATAENLSELKGLRVDCSKTLDFIHKALKDGEKTKSLHKRTPDNKEKVERFVSLLNEIKGHISMVIFHFRRNDESEQQKEKRVQEQKEKEKRELFERGEQKRMQDLLKKFLDAQRANAESNYLNVETPETMAEELLASRHVSDEAKRMVQDYIRQRTTSEVLRFVVPSATRSGEFYEVLGRREVLPADQEVCSHGFPL